MKGLLEEVPCPPLLQTRGLRKRLEEQFNLRARDFFDSNHLYLRAFLLLGGGRGGGGGDKKEDGERARETFAFSVVRCSPCGAFRNGRARGSGPPGTRAARSQVLVPMATERLRMSLPVALPFVVRDQTERQGATGELNDLN